MDNKHNLWSHCSYLLRDWDNSNFSKKWSQFFTKQIYHFSQQWGKCFNPVCFLTSHPDTQSVIWCQEKKYKGLMYLQNHLGSQLSWLEQVTYWTVLSQVGRFQERWRSGLSGGSQAPLAPTSLEFALFPSKHWSFPKRNHQIFVF